MTTLQFFRFVRKDAYQNREGPHSDQRWAERAGIPREEARGHIALLSDLGLLCAEAAWYTVTDNDEAEAVLEGRSSPPLGDQGWQEFLRRVEVQP